MKTPSAITRRRQRSTDRSPDRIVQRSTELLLRGAYAEALKILTPAAARYSDNAPLLVRYADALYQTGDIAAARDAYHRALALDDSLFQAWYGQGMTEISFEAYAVAIQSFCRALVLRPREPDVRFYLASALFEMGRLDDAIDELLIVARNRQWRRRALQKIAVLVPGSPSRGNEAILKARQRWARIEEKLERPATRKSKRPSTSKKLRIGYVSSFFHHRNWMKPVWGVINRHDRSAFEIHLFADRANPTAESGYHSNPVDAVHSITKLSNRDAAVKIARAEIDVLVDLNGYSAPNRLGIFMRKPAPTIVGWFSMYATTGIQAFDYIIGDAVVIPPNEERFCSERVLRVEGSYMAFSVLYTVPDVVPPPCCHNGYLTFGCLAPQYKVTQQEVAAWAQILCGAPSARLLLKNICMEDAGNRAAVLAQFAAHGVAPERLLLEGPSEHYEFLQAYDRIDVALDTFPYNGGTTTAESLWQGVPVLAFDGDRWAARISRSILLAAALPEWVTPSEKTYINRAIELAVSAQTPKLLASLRKRMRARLLASQVCNTKRLCGELEQIYRRVAKCERSRPTGR